MEQKKKELGNKFASNPRLRECMFNVDARPFPQETRKYNTPGCVN